MLDEIERSIFQIIISYGCIKDSSLIEVLASLKEEFKIDDEIDYKIVFSNINRKIRDLFLEIKSVYVLDSEGNRNIFHGVVNNKEDFSSKKFGNIFDAIEAKYFSKILLNLINDKYMSTSEIIEHKPENWMNSRVDSFLRQLFSQSWLGKNHLNYWVIGPRSFIELRSYIESSIMDSINETGNINKSEDDINLSQAKKKVDDLPQLILY